MKKNIRYILITLAAVLAVSVFGFTIYAAETYEGSDLPVSESYVIRALNELEERLIKKIDTLADSIGAEIPEDTTAETESSATETKPENDSTSASTEFTVVCLKKGQSITGSCELILRSGSANALCPGVNGLSDLTDGSDLADGTQILPNHLLLVPRSDGRGLTVTSTEAYIMVRGTYAVTDAVQ
ncbi:MAG: hypothetical protein ACI3XM_11905 [Eubacteriales bacterium]